MRRRPLCVDLDGTVVRTDTLLESVLALVRSDPLALPRLALWVLRGKAAFKHEVAARTSLDYPRLPYHQGLLRYLREHRRSGRRLVLATGAPRRIAQRVARHLGLFSSILSSDERVNLSGRRKAEALVRAFGKRNFDYVGSGRQDLPVWKAAGEAVVVEAGGWVLGRARAAARVSKVFERRGCFWMDSLRAMRVHQWVKNLLLFVPLVMAHRSGESPLLLRTAAAFLAFSLYASAGYIINDLLDLESDRKSSTNKRRPFASGDLQASWGLCLAGGLLGAGAWTGSLLSPPFLYILSGYLGMHLAYSFFFKHLALLDVLTLTGLYGWRLWAGGAAAGVPLSAWLLAFALFLFLSLALAKRCAELILLSKTGLLRSPGRGYRVSDLNLLISLGASSGYLAVLVLALYINSEATRALYDSPHLLWALCPVMLYWISRLWLTVHRGQMGGDPVLHAIKDKASYLLGGLLIAILWLASEA